MEDNSGNSSEEIEVDIHPRHGRPLSQTNNRPLWSNGQCVLAVPSFSMLNTRFDIPLCRAMLERNGFQIPIRDFEEPLKTALDIPSVRRYIVFNSAFFHFMMAPVLYVVIWCAVFSTLHLYMTATDYWVLCLSVSVVTIFLTTSIICVLHHSNKQINMNVDIRLIQVNERMVKHKLLVGVADWVQNCTGTLQLFCVYWDMHHCLHALTEILEERSYAANEIQKKLRTKMSHLVLTSEVRADGPHDPEVRGSGQVEGRLEEERPLLLDEEAGRSTTSSQREDTKITTNYSLIPDTTLPPQAKAHQLLITYSAAYIKLLVSERLPRPPQHHLQPLRNHCSTVSLCLCQYINNNFLR